MKTTQLFTVVVAGLMLVIGCAKERAPKMTTPVTDENFALAETQIIMTDYVKKIATGENGTDEAYVADTMVYTNWLNDAVLWMPFPAEKLEGTYYDYSREGNDGAQTTAGFRPAWTNGWGGVYQLDGSDDYIDLGSNAFWLTNNFTVAVWVKADGINVGTIQQIIGTSGGRWAINEWNGNWNFQFYDGTMHYSSAASVSNAWVHLVGVKSNTGDGSVLYVDGVKQTPTSDTSPVAYFAGSTLVGNDAYLSPTFIYGGGIDDVRIYDRNLSSNEVFNIHAATSGAHQ